MFREMRRKGQQLSQEESWDILAAGSSGVLAVLGDEGYPYAVPLSYACRDGRLYFHSAVTGHKLDAARREPRASFCVIAQDQVIADKFTTAYRSAIAFGRLRVLSDPGEMEAALRALAEKYSPAETEAALRHEIDGAAGRVAILELTVEHLTGKEGIELTRARRG